MEWFIVDGNRQKMDGGAMFGNAPKALWSRWFDCDESNRVDLACHCLVIKTDELTILMDTGVGAFMDPKYASRYGVEQADNVLISNLASKGVAEGDVDYVILSHLHFDHVGGLLPDWLGSVLPCQWGGSRRLALSLKPNPLPRFGRNEAQFSNSKLILSFYLFIKKVVTSFPFLKGLL